MKRRPRPLLILLLLALPAGGMAKPVDARSIEQLLTGAKDPLVRESAAQVLGTRGGQSVVAQLTRRLAKDDNRWVRARCAESLGRIGDPRAIRALDSALSREKDQRVRRSIAQALVRFGQRSGLDELMWQLKAGTNNTKAEVMAFLVEITGQPLGQNVKAWWAFFAARGKIFLARRPRGEPAVLELPGLRASGSAGPRLHGDGVQSWGVIPAVVIELPPSRTPVTRRTLAAHVRRHGPIPDGCLLLINTNWRRAAPPRRGGPKGKPPPPEIGITHEAVQQLMKLAPQMIGIGIDTHTIDPAPPDGSPKSDAARRSLVSKGKLVLEALDDIDRLPRTGARLVLVRLPGSAPGKANVRVLALLP